MTYTIAVCTVKSPDDRQRNCTKHVEFHSKNKFEELVHLVGFNAHTHTHTHKVVYSSAYPKRFLVNSRIVPNDTLYFYTDLHKVIFEIRRT
jgi:hypothetical protein